LLPTSSEAEPGMRGRPNARPRGRAAVGWCLAAAVGSQLALAVIQELWRPDLRDAEYGNKLLLLRRQTAAAPDRPLLLALGSSRTLNGLRPDLLPPDGPRVFNFGMIWHGPVRQALALDRVLRDGVRPCWVTIELIPLFLPEGSAALDRVPVAQYAWGDVQFLRAHGFCPPEVTGEWLEARALPAYASRFTLMSRVLSAWLPWAHREDFHRENTAADGWLTIPPATTELQIREARERMTRDVSGQLGHFVIAPDSERALRLSLEQCRAEGIGAAVVLMPEASWFRELLSPAGERQVQKLVAAVGHEFTVPAIDARGWCPDDEFRDGHHLIAAGATRFTARFGREVMPLLCDHDASAKRR
jgi:hypothetical protein